LKFKSTNIQSENESKDIEVEVKNFKCPDEYLSCYLYVNGVKVEGSSKSKVSSVFKNQRSYMGKDSCLKNEIFDVLADKFIHNSWRNFSYSKLNIFVPLGINYLIKGLHFLLYLVAIWYLILRTKFKKSSLNEYPKQVKIVSNWLFFFAVIVSFLGFLISRIILTFLNADNRIILQNEGNILFLLVFVGLLIFIIGLVLYPRILYGIHLERESLKFNVNDASVSGKGKIETISFDEDYIEKIRLLFLNWIEQKKYLDAESTTSSLSKDIDLPIHHVTYFFNNVNDEKYIEWRNRKRIEYAMSLINSKNGYNKTIENLGKESGFKSYSAFIQSFKQITGKLPKDYIKDIKS
jgi:AraC-like DNA-binding protein